MIVHERVPSPLLGLQRSRLPPLFLKPPARLFQLCERVGGWVGGHGWVLDEGMGGLHVIAELSGHPRVHGPRPFHRTWPRHLVTLSFLGAGDAAKEQARPKELLHDSLQKTVVCYNFASFLTQLYEKMVSGQPFIVYKSRECKTLINNEDGFSPVRAPLIASSFLLTLHHPLQYLLVPLHIISGQGFSHLKVSTIFSFSDRPL